MLNRRTFLSMSGLLPLCGMLPGPRLPEGARGKTLVLVFLRGGMDGLNLIVPYGESEYARRRGWIAVRRPGEPDGALDLDGHFGLHPWAAPLLPFFEDGRAVGVHAVGNARNTRSHFEEQDVWETARLENTIRSDGWLNRHLQTTSGTGPVRAVTVGDTLPRILRGEARALAIRGLQDFQLGQTASDAEARLARLREAYDRESVEHEALGRAGRDAIEALRELSRVAARPYEPRAEYPEEEFAGRLQEVARLIRADVGLEVAGLDLGGWDTHQNQGGVGGQYSQLVRRLAGGLAAFLNDLEDRADDVLVLCLSEFGRTVSINGTGGTDHGWGNCAVALGGPVREAGDGKPRKLLGEWPGLEPEQLRDGRDLRHTTDFRDVVHEVVTGHLGNPRPEAVLGDYEPQRDLALC